MVPSLEDVMKYQYCTWGTVCSVQVAPESVDVQIFPLNTVRASFDPSLEDVMQFVLPTDVFSVQVAPESAEVQIFVPEPPAASLVPSLEDVMLAHRFELPTEVQVACAGTNADSARTRVKR